MNYNIDLRRAVKSEEFKNYWAVQDRKNWKIKATKNTIQYLFEDNSVFATFTIKLFEEEDLGVGIYAEGQMIIEELEIDTFECTENEIAKAIAYYFWSRY